MMKKINAVFRSHRQDYHSACTVKLVRSASMLAVGERGHAQRDSTLKRSASAVSVRSGTGLYCYHSREERVWLYYHNRECLEYLQELVALRRRYTDTVKELKLTEQSSSTKKPAPQPPQHESPQPSAPPVLSEEDTLQFFDAVIASCDSERTRKPHVDNGHADVDFIVATSTSQHDLHSNWTLRDPRRICTGESRVKRAEAGSDENAWRKAAGGTTSSVRRLQRNPIHLPKVVESALQTLRFKPKLKKKD
ncbi:hypothetical protein QTP86_004232 [Hemibagrus guttatus]|nr:hypothetical protein QTP86_004232 [Hemibagrus guttatus]